MQDIIGSRAFNSSMWGSLRLAPIKKILQIEREGSAKKKQNKNSRDNQHVLGTSLRLLFSSEGVILYCFFILALYTCQGI